MSFNNRKPTNSGKLNKSILNNFWVKGEIRNKDVLEFNENECTRYPNLCDSIRGVLREELPALSAFMRKLERFYTSNFNSTTEVSRTKRSKHT